MELFVILKNRLILKLIQNQTENFVCTFPIFLKFYFILKKILVTVGTI